MRSIVLVALQMALIAVIAWPFAGASFDGRALVVIGAAIAVGVWALSANRPGNFNIRPEPKAEGRLVTAGPYRYVRHPMYLAVLLFALGCCLGYGEGWRWVAWAALALVLHVKAGIEERALAARYAGYAAYRARTKRLLPLLW